MKTNIFKPELTARFSIASMCLKRLKDGEPCTDPIVRKPDLRDYRDQDGKPCTIHRVVAITGMSFQRVKQLYGQYQGDCSRIYDNHGKTNKNTGQLTKFRDRDGSQMNCRNIARKYKWPVNRVSSMFGMVDFDHVKAFDKLDNYVAVKK